MRTVHITFPSIDDGNPNRAAILRTMRMIIGGELLATLNIVKSGSHRLSFDGVSAVMRGTDEKLAELQRLGCTVEQCTELRRYNIDSNGLPVKDVQGVFVDYRDYRELEQQLTALKAALRELVS